MLPNHQNGTKNRARFLSILGSPGQNILSPLRKKMGRLDRIKNVVNLDMVKFGDQPAISLASMFQISRAYSLIVRSLENLPDRAML